MSLPGMEAAMQGCSTRRAMEKKEEGAFSRSLLIIPELYVVVSKIRHVYSKRRPHNFKTRLTPGSACLQGIDLSFRWFRSLLAIPNEDETHHLATHIANG